MEWRGKRPARPCIPWSPKGLCTWCKAVAPTSRRAIERHLRIVAAVHSGSLERCAQEPITGLTAKSARDLLVRPDDELIVGRERYIVRGLARPPALGAHHDRHRTGN